MTLLKGEHLLGSFSVLGDRGDSNIPGNVGIRYFSLYKDTQFHQNLFKSPQAAVNNNNKNKYWKKKKINGSYTAQYIFQLGYSTQKEKE